MERNYFLLLTPTELYEGVTLQKPLTMITNHPVKQDFASLELQLQPRPAPPLMAPR